MEVIVTGAFLLILSLNSAGGKLVIRRRRRPHEIALLRSGSYNAELHLSSHETLLSNTQSLPTHLHMPLTMTIKNGQFGTSHGILSLSWL